jgi:hypothetical protein
MGVIHMMRIHALLLLALLIGCGGQAISPQPMNGPFALFPTEAYTGVENTGARYTVPIAATGATGIQWTSSDSSVMSAAGTDQVSTVTGLKAGSATVTATAGSATLSTRVTVLSYTASDREAGHTAYTKFNCAACHEGASTAPDITPSGIGHHDDLAIQAAVTQGANPEGGDVAVGKLNHSFPIDQNSAAYVGIVAFLRSQTPRGIPVQDK